MRPGSKDLKGFPEPASGDMELKSLVSIVCLYCRVAHGLPGREQHDAAE